MKKPSYDALHVRFGAAVILGMLFLGHSSLLQAQPVAGLPLAEAFQKKHTDELLFIENKGQISGAKGEPQPEVLFMARGQGCKIFVSANELSYQFERVEYPEGYNPMDRTLSLERRTALGKQAKTSSHRFSMRLLGANPNPKVHREKKTAYYENYYNLPAAPEGILNVPSYSELRIEEIYPGIDWVIYSNAQGIKYDFVVSPGADPSRIQLEYSDADELNLNADGSLTISTSLGTVTEAAPVCYQAQKLLNSRFVLTGNRVSFALEDYDPREPLIIDPDVVWATYYGGVGLDSGHSVETDAAGNVYLTGSTSSNSAIAAAGHQNAISSQSDAFLVKFNSDGVRQWATYYGGGGFDSGLSLAADAAGNIYMGGSTSSSFNIAAGGHQNVYGGDTDAMLVKFNTNGIRQWATYYGGTENDTGLSVATDAGGNVYLAGYSLSLSGIAAAGHQNTPAGNEDAFLAKFNANGVRQWATYYGGELDDEGWSLVSDLAGNIYLTGQTRSVGGIASGGHQNTLGGNLDAFLVKFNGNGTRQWATYYGGAGGELGWAVASDLDGNIYLAGQTRSTSGIAFGGYQMLIGGAEDAFLAKFDAGGHRLWASYYGGPQEDLGVAVVVDAVGYPYLAGRTNSTTGIAFQGYQNNHAGGFYDTFLVRFNPNGTRQWGTYYGGEGADHTITAHIDVFGSLYVAGRTTSANGVAVGGHQNVYGGAQDAFLVKFCATPAYLPVLTEPNCPGSNDGQIAFTNLVGANNYEFSINNGTTWESTSVYTDLASGNYTLLIRNASLTVCASGPQVNILGAGDHTPPVALCQNATLQLATDGSATILAAALDNGSFDNCSVVSLSLNQTVFDCSDLGVNTLLLTVTDLNGNSNTCNPVVTVLDPVDAAALAAPILLSIPNALCPGEVQTVTAFSEGTSAYIWLDGSTGPDYDIPGPGTYQLRVVKGCGQVDTAFVVGALALPELEIPENDANLCPGNSTLITAVTDGEVEWSNGQINPVIRVDQPGLYIATASNHCGSVVDSVTLVAQGCENCFYIPNAFSPNSDDINDRFVVESLCPVAEYRLRMFSRWGELLFDSKQTYEGWDGTTRGKPLPQGVYVWLLVYNQDGKSFERSGEVNLLR